MTHFGWRRNRSRTGDSDEMQTHLDLLAAQLMAEGRSPEEARRQARLRFGNPRVRQEEVDALRRSGVIDAFIRDLRYAVRVLRRAPLFALSAILILAIVIGANGAVFGLIDAIIVRKLPYPNADRLGSITLGVPGQSTLSVQTRHSGVTWELVRQAQTIDVVAVRLGRSGVNLFARGAARVVTQGRVGAGYFGLLGVPLAIGRDFTQDEDRPGGPAVAIVSYALWQDVLGGDPAAVGQDLFLRGERYQVVGVAPRDFLSLGSKIDVFTPVRPSRGGEGGGNNYQLLARVRDGRSWTEANAELAALGRTTDSTATPAGRVLSVIPLKQDLAQGASIFLAILAAGGVLLLLVACVNLGGLCLGRARSRTAELATRMALGGSRGAVIRQLLTEGVVIGAAGGAAGLAIGAFVIRGLRVLGGDVLGQWQVVSLDGRMVAITAVLAVVVTLAFAVAPAWQASRISPAGVIGAGPSRAIAGGVSQWTSRILVATEIALGVMLVAMAAMFLQGMLRLQRLDPGFDPNGLTVGRVSLQDARYADAESVTRLMSATLETLRSTPGVESASVSLEMPYRTLPNFPVRFADRPAGPGILNTNVMYVTPEFFDTFKIPVRAGRGVTAYDRNGPPIAVVNQAFVRLLGEGRNPIGRPLVLSTLRPTVVGVVGDVQAGDPGFSLAGMSRDLVMAPPILFIPVSQMPDGLLKLFHSFSSPVWAVRAGAGVNVGMALQRAFQDADPLLPPPTPRRITDIQWEATRTPRLFATFMSLLAAVALVLACVGLYALVAQAVLERRREFGVRMALGATPGRILTTVARGGLILSAAGGVLGLALAWLASNVLASFLVGAAPREPVSFAVVALLLGVVTTIASVIPARGILRIDPATILRE
jgi:predicted permease